MEESIKTLIIRYLQGSANQSEITTLNNWRSQNDNEEVFQEMVHIWNSSSQAEEIKVDVEKSWRQFTASNQPARKISVYTAVIRMAAILVVGLGLGFLLINLIRKDSGSLTTISADHIKREVQLADGTLVWLAPQSSLTFPGQFETNQRKVTLKGQAFFDVKKNENAPFVINTNQSVIKVLGTSFNVKSGHDKTEVTVATGKVVLSPYKTKDSVFITPGETGFHDSKSGNLHKEANQNINFNSWMTGRFVFDNESLEQIIQTLNEHYSTPIRLTTLGSECVLTTIFENQPLDEIMEELELALGITYEQVDNTILITSTKCAVQ